MKKLIPTICMTLLGLSVVATSSYAWFTMNRTVNATGMKVQARGEGGIVIDRLVNAADTTNHVFTKAEREELSVSATLATPSDATLLLPTSTANMENWYHANAAASNDEAAIATSYEEVSANAKWTEQDPEDNDCGYGMIDPTTTEGDELIYYVYDEIAVLPDALSSSFDNLWLDYCSVATATNDLSKSLRVGFVCDSNKVIAAPVSGASTSYSVNKAASAEIAVATTGSSSSAPLATDITTAGTKKVVLNNTPNNTQLNVKIIVWFEGEDANHYTDNYLAAVEETLDTLTVTCGFTCTTVHAA